MPGTRGGAQHSLAVSSMCASDATVTTAGSSAGQDRGRIRRPKEASKDPQEQAKGHKANRIASEERSINVIMDVAMV